MRHVHRSRHTDMSGAVHMSHKILHASDLPEEWPKESLYPYTLSGYRYKYTAEEALRSVLSNKHNEFFNIWTDIIAVLAFTSALCVFTASHVGNLDSTDFWLCIGVFSGVIVSRICSTLTHIFNCLNAKLSKNIWNLDQIGICHMALGSPFMWVVANGSRSFN